MALSGPTRALSLLCFLLLLTGGCAPDDPGPEASDEAESAAVRSSEAQAVRTDGGAGDSITRVALPGLFSIMIGLQADMAKVSRGLWMENLDTVSAGADAVADHPRVPPREFERISDILGADMSRFGAMDGEVHDLAVRLSEAAARGALDEVLAAESDLRRGCVDCHSEFRDRLRTSLSAPASTR